MVSSHLAVLLAAAGAIGAHAASIQPQVSPRDISLARRAVSDAPNGYVPGDVSCPSTRPTIRNGTSLSRQERDWVQTRRNETLAPMRDLLRRIGIRDFNVEEYLGDGESNNIAIPNIGIAVSGGGYRAMLNGAGGLAAFDSRSDGSTEPGNLGGLLQASTYLSGLSGGGWLIGSLYINNFTSVQASVQSPEIWQFENSILEGPEEESFLNYYTDVYDATNAKEDAGYNTTIVDLWGRMLSYQLVNLTEGGPGVTFSSIQDDEEFAAGRTPLPFVVALGRSPDETALSVNSTVFEFTPWEMGSSDNVLSGYVPLRWVGSRFDNGSLPDDESCVRGFDNAGFVLGTSSSLFNAALLYLQDEDNEYVPDGIPDFAISGLSSILETWGESYNDIADWSPNPFYGWNPDVNLGAESRRLTLVDGGMDLQNIPLHPLLSIEREVDVVFAIDSSADTNLSWPDGQAMQATYQRSLVDISEGTGFPSVPSRRSFINLGLNAHPTFFGCNSTNVTDPHPLIVYLPNAPYQYWSNTSTYQMAYNESERDAMVQNGWAVVTQQNATVDAEWPRCVGCAILHRSFERTNTTIPQDCQQCYERYCWNGDIDESEPDVYAPSLFGELIDVQSAAVGVVGSSAIVLAVSAAVGMALML
jgi:lysophospholipase